MSKNGMWGGLSNRNFKQSLSYLPNSKTQYTIDFNRLDGGLNLYELDYRLDPNESPDMKNLRWKDGALGCRDGQLWLIEPAEVDPAEVGYAAYNDLFWDYAFVHVDDEIRCFDPEALTPAYTVLKTGVPTNRGTFFRYGDNLMYKNTGGYYQIAYDSTGVTPATMFPVTTSANHEFKPITYINCKPATAAGDAYQPQNRLSDEVEMWYSAESGVTQYYLPASTATNYISAVTKVTVDGVTYTKVNSSPGATQYTVTNDANGHPSYITFGVAPPVATPFEANTVHICYSIAGSDYTDAYNAVMNCPYAIVYGGDQNLCVVVGGCEAQPNAYFWSGNDQYSMNPFYFPMEHYNLAGDTESAVMGFGKQQGLLVVFSKKGVGKVKFGTTTTSSDRLQIEMPYTAINSRIGCDFPWSIQLVDNNLVFCNQEHGVCIVADSSAAYENNILELGKKINGNDRRHGMLFDTFLAGEGGVYSTIFEDKYWLVANDNAYVWDFRLSTASNPVWFYYTNIKGIAYFSHADVLYHLSAGGGATKFSPRSFSDYDEPIDKVYQFATQMMRTYDRLKNVVSAIFVVRSDTDTLTHIKYMTDYEDRYDLTPIRTFSWHLVPRDLSYRYLGVQRFAHVERRRPMCRHVRHFAMRLENNVIGQDLSVISAQVFYNYQGEQK